MTGKVIAGERFKVVVKFFPGVPDNIDEMLLVECGHFPAERFKVKAVGIYPGCLLSFPRQGDEDYAPRIDQAKHRLEGGEGTYSAPFNGDDAVRLMPPLLSKMADREKAIIKDPRMMEFEAESDRDLLCTLIVRKLEQAKLSAHQQASYSAVTPGAQLNQSTASGQGAAAKKGAAAGKGPAKRGAPTTRTPGHAADDRSSLATSFAGGVANMENISIATYVCDFNNVVVGSTKRKSFRLTNVGRLPVTFNFDKKLLTQAGITIEPDKVQKVGPNCSTLFNVVYTTRTNAKFGKQKFMVPIDVKGGPSYQIEFCANLTIPELSMSSENLDFGKVCVQTRKTAKIKFENKKEVPCDWSYYYKPDISAAATAAKEGDRF
mmetsp:Transcript_39618/g.60627  ORF Transcript_39618/g.60627 Transcript_39618/m.60627 type:complete len:376 (-) Transcript_39618:9170-10297(-)